MMIKFNQGVEVPNIKLTSFKVAIMQQSRLAAYAFKITFVPKHSCNKNYTRLFTFLILSMVVHVYSLLLFLLLVFGFLFNWISNHVIVNMIIFCFSVQPCTSHLWIILPFIYSHDLVLSSAVFESTQSCSLFFHEVDINADDYSISLWLVANENARNSPFV